ncbi:MAG: hypothetical protein KW793_04385 [Candidatus Doudnabacteria bacterium]|nr:hypothetical protein [Candidatus Doudnabacteria bacterium]
MNKKTIVAPESKTKKIEVELSREEDQTPLHYEALAAHKRALARYESKRQFTSPIEELVQDISVMVGTVKFPGADEAYPDVTQALMRFVTKIYPNAIGGPLYVDQPRNDVEVYRAYERQKVMRQLGLRHVIIERDSTLEHLLEQLGEM